MDLLIKIDKKQAAELKEGVLKVNYGIPIIIVANKAKPY